MSIFIMAIHIPGDQNRKADTISRNTMYLTVLFSPFTGGKPPFPSVIRKALVPPLGNRPARSDFTQLVPVVQELQVLIAELAASNLKICKIHAMVTTTSVQHDIIAYSTSKSAITCKILYVAFSFKESICYKLCYCRCKL